MARRKRKNPNGNHPGVGAFLGSLGGGIPGHVMTALGASNLGAVLTGAGWIAGGAIGGYYGAKPDRRGRGAAGGAIGGIFTPLGAALGGYIGGRKPDAKRNPRKMNPTPGTIAIAVGAGIAAVGAGYGLYRVTKGGKVFPGSKKQLEPEEALQGVVGNSTLEEASFMVGDIQQPIMLQVRRFPADGSFAKIPVLRVKVEPPSGDPIVEEPAGARFGTAFAEGVDDNELTLVADDGDVARYPMTRDKAIAYLITGLSTDSAQLAYELVLINIADRGVNWADPEQRDATIQKILADIAPKMDWSARLQPHAYGSHAWQAWAGVEIVGAIANQSFFNKQVLGEA